MYLKNGFIKPSPTTDLPVFFLDGLRSIDKDLCVFFHPFDVIYDDVMNYYTGSLEDPRFNIHRAGSHLGDINIFGWILETKKGIPKSDNTYHIWRYSSAACGYNHILKIEDRNNIPYLQLILKRLLKQARFSDKYGSRRWGRVLEEEREEQRQDEQKSKADLFSDVQKENRWLLSKAAENLASGKIQPTSPTKEIITSYPGQKNRTKIVRPITDEEGGLVVPDDM